MHSDELAKKDFTSYLNIHEKKELLRFILCGSVDDGKSTLIGRMLYESQALYTDQLENLVAESKQFGNTAEELDFSLVVDGLLAEREQGITIDVAYRFFTGKQRKFIVADTPGHEQYTRNMATAASNAQVALVLVDARTGILTQTRRHSIIANLFGIKHLILVVNKMDLVNYDQSIYATITAEYKNFLQALTIESMQAIPVSALYGANILTNAQEMPWYQGPTVLNYLDTMTVTAPREKHALRMGVQWVNRTQDFRGFAGRITAGTISPGQRIRILPGQQYTQVARIVGYDGDLAQASAGQSVMLTMQDEVDISRGTVLSCAEDPCEVAEQFATRLLWMSETPMVSGRHYLFKSNTVTALCTLSKAKYRIDVNTMGHLAIEQLALNEIGDCELFLDRPIAFETYTKSKELGSFILIDRVTQATVAAGLLHAALRPETYLMAYPSLVDKAERAALKRQQPVVLWFTGLSGAGKSTIANLLERQLNAQGRHTMLLDGDSIRHGISRDLDFSVSGRAENSRRVAEIAKLMADAGLITLVSLISPFRAERASARQCIGAQQFLEIHIDIPLATAMERDAKGLYKKAQAGEIKDFTGITSPYEIPLAPEMHIDTTRLDPQQAVVKIMALLQNKKIIS